MDIQAPMTKTSRLSFDGCVVLVLLACEQAIVPQACLLRSPSEASSKLTFLRSFTAWTLMKSPLIIGTDLSNATNQTLQILGNKDLIKINQDPNVGESISPFRWGINSDYVSNSSFPAQYWSGNSSYGVVFMILNTQDSSQQMFFNLTESWAIRAGRQYSVYDLWEHRTTGMAVR